MSSGPRSAEGGPWESSDEGVPLGDFYISDCSKPLVLRMQVQYFEGEGEPSELIPIRAGMPGRQRKTSKGLRDWQTQPWIGPSSFFICIQYRSCQNHIKCKKTLEQKMYIFPFIRCCFVLLEHLGIVLVFNG